MMTGLVKTDIPSGCNSEPPDRVVVGIILINHILIALAYYAIPAQLAYFYFKIRTRRVPYRLTLILFVSFIAFCGMTHTLQAIFFYRPWWIAHAVIGMATALVSLVTSWYLYSIIPRVLALPAMVQDLEENVQQRLLSEQGLQQDIEALQVLRDVNHQLRTTQDKRSLINALVNSLITYLNAYNVILFIDGYHVFSMPPWSGKERIVIDPATQTISSTTTVTRLDLSVVENVLGIAPAEGSWFLCSFNEPERQVDGFVFVHFREQVSEDAITMSRSAGRLLVDIMEQFNTSLRMVNLITVDQKRIAQLAQQNEQLTKARQEAQYAETESKQLLYLVSHEMRTPLYAISTLSELILQKKMDNRITEDVTLIHKSGKMLTRIVENILDFSRLEHGDVVLRKEAVWLRPLIEDTMTEYVVTTGSDQSVPIVGLLLDTSADIMLIGDAMRFRQLFGHLFSNAVKYTPEQGQVRVTVRGEPDPDQVHYHIHCSIADTGKGIDPDKVDALFKEFQQTETTVTRQHGGMGLGLAIVKKLAQLMQGDVSYAPNQPLGSVFSFHVVFDIFDHTKHTPVPNPLPDLLPNYKHLKIGLDCQHPMDLEAASHLFKLVDLQPYTQLEDIGTLDGILSDRPQTSYNKPTFYLIKLNESVKDVSKALVKYSYRPLTLRSLILWLNDILRHQSPVKEVDEPADFFLTPLHILVVEDNRINQIVIQKTLQQLGQTQIDVADNGYLALEKCKKTDYDLILMDLMMPGISGFETTRKIHDLYHSPAKTGRTVPYIVALTANATAEAQVSANEAGMDGFLVKPASVNTMKQTLMTLSQKKIVPPL